MAELNQHFGSVRFVKSFSQLFRSRYYKRFGKGVSSRRIQDLLVKKKSLPKIGLVDFVQHRQLPEGKIKICTISRNATGKYHISILLEREQNEVIPALVDESQTIAGDLGVLGLHKILMPLVFWVVHHACRFLSKTWLLIHQRLLQPSCLCRGHSLPLDRVRLRQRQWLLAATPLFLFHRFIRPL